MHRAARFVMSLVLVCGAAACGAERFEDLIIDEVSLSNFQFGQAGVVLGYSDATADMELRDLDGETHQFVAHLTGPAIGFILDAEFAQPPIAFNDEDVKVSKPNTSPALGKDMLGGYFGSTFSGMLVGGAAGVSMTNDKGAAIDALVYGYGLGGAVGLTWLNLDVRDP